ncbi:MAG TPA: PAS domain-containing methyl-accepting chemotaxis protein [Alphaproteobacteria bacterium]|nr:PAS domain-containing methyl-accepting chemotaxis protein [Alphaproteobacteria bacterium]
MLQNELDAIYKSQAVIEFETSGIILWANDNFLNAVGYSLDEIKGKHHSMFADPEYARSEEYRLFWEKLRRGEFDAGEYRRFGKGGKEIWIHASYNPIIDKNGTVIKVKKFASDITPQKQASADMHGQIDAIGKSQAVIEFNLDGTIIDANQNFLDAVGYSLEEIRGQHHMMFADPEYARTDEYRRFWEKLRRGEFDAGEYRRYGNNSKEIWINASYNPIFDASGRPFKVVKYASDVTRAKLQNADYQGQIHAISKVQAVIQFDLDGKILTANDAFLSAMGYSLEEIEGRHHRMFVDAAESQSEDYVRFWENLRQGIYESKVYKRIAKGGREIWIQASYNPILDMNGKPFKVVKYANDITEMVALTDSTGKNVQTVAAATEEMATSINEISKNMELSEEAANIILEKTAAAGQASTQLVQTTDAMENIVRLIRDIAEQVNLLALNATIEAARAGDAGKGFAVVASEVKNLANQTANATDDIAREIASVQRISTQVADGVKEIVDVAAKVGEYVTTVSAALQQQTAVTMDISANLQKMLEAVNGISAQVRKMA